LVIRPLFLSRFYCRSEGVSQPSHQKLRFQPLRRKKVLPQNQPRWAASNTSASYRFHLYVAAAQRCV